MLLFKAFWRDLKRHKWQSLLSLGGVAIGVAAVTSIDFANEGARRGFDYAHRAVSSDAGFRIQSPQGDIDEQVYVALRKQGVSAITPIVRGKVSLLISARGSNQAQKKDFEILGVDPLSRLRGDQVFSGGRLDSTLLTRSNAVMALADSDAGVERGAVLDIETVTGKTRLIVSDLITPASSIEKEGLKRVLIADISTAQEVLNKVGYLSYIDVFVRNADEHVVSMVKELLPPMLELIDLHKDRETRSQMTRAFQTNLTALSLLALLIGMFLIYNAMSFSVLRRRSLLGVLRSIGATRVQVFFMVMSEALVVGLAATAIGLVIGIWLADVLLKLILLTIDNLYFDTLITGISLSAITWIKALSVGVIATVVAALLPAVEASKTQPRMTLIRANVEQASGRFFNSTRWFGMALMLAALLPLSENSLSENSLLPGFAGLFLIVFGYAFCVPGFCLQLLNALSRMPFVRGGLTARMSVREIARSSSRTGPAIAALTVAMAAVTGVGIMIDSFRGSVDEWLGERLRADVYFTVEQPSASLPRVLLDDIAKKPDVTSLATAHHIKVQSADGPVKIFALDANRYAFDGFRLLQGDSDTAWKLFTKGEGVLLSEPFAYRRSLKVQDTLELPTAQGKTRFEVAGIYSDYASDQGIVLIHKSRYAALWNDATTTSASVYLKPDASSDEFINYLANHAQKPKGLASYSARSLRKASLNVFDQTFKITAVLRVLAIIVAVIGVIAALLAIHIERARDYAVMRAVGLLPKQLWRLVMMESTVMGTLAGLLSIPLGIGMAWILINVINKRSFGWSMQITIDPAIAMQAVALAILAALIAAVYPGIRLANALPSASLRDE